VKPVGNRSCYSLAKRAELEAFVGSMPTITPNWMAIIGMTGQLVRLESAAETGTTRTLAVKARTALDVIEEELDELGIDPPNSYPGGEELWPAVRSLGNETLGEWSLGRWHLPPRGAS